MSRVADGTAYASISGMSKNTPKMPVRKAIVFAGTGNCPMCGKTVKLRPFNSKLRYSHKCPHGMDCDQGNRLIGVHTFKPEHSRCDQCRAAPTVKASKS